MILGYRSGFCGVWVVWNYYTYTAKHFSTLKCKHTPGCYNHIFNVHFVIKINIDYSRIIDGYKKLLKIAENETSVLFLLSVTVWLSVFVVNTSVFLWHTIIRSSMWYHFDIILISNTKNYLTLLNNFNTFNNYSTLFSTICWKLKTKQNCLIKHKSIINYTKQKCITKIKLHISHHI